MKIQTQVYFLYSVFGGSLKLTLALRVRVHLERLAVFSFKMHMFVLNSLPLKRFEPNLNLQQPPGDANTDSNLCQLAPTVQTATTHFIHEQE